LIQRLPPVRISGEGYDTKAILETYEEDGVLVCGVYRLDGTIRLEPKAWLRAVRAEMTKLETIARDAGCAEMRIAGRDWSRVLPDYEPLPGGKPNRLRKRL
jgi:hypothetical protein